MSFLLNVHCLDGRNNCNVRCAYVISNCVATMKGQHTPARNLHDLATLTEDLTSAVRVRQNQLSGDIQSGGGGQAPAGVLAQTPSTAPQSDIANLAPGSRSLQTPSFQESAGIQRRTSERLNKTSSSARDSGGRRISERLQNLRLNFENSKGRSDAQSSSSVTDKNGDKPPGLSTNIRSAQSSLGANSHTLPASASVVPSTSLRKNVTERRSNGRARDSLGSTSVPVSKLLERVPLGRPQDEAYARETRMGHQDSHLSSPGIGNDAVSSPAKKTSFSIPDFTRKDIPAEWEKAV